MRPSVKPVSFEVIKSHFKNTSQELGVKGEYQGHYRKSISCLHRSRVIGIGKLVNLNKNKKISDLKKVIINETVRGPI